MAGRPAQAGFNGGWLHVSAQLASREIETEAESGQRDGSSPFLSVFIRAHLWFN
jgi:hypothetical protein